MSTCFISVYIEQLQRQTLKIIYPEINSKDAIRASENDNSKEQKREIKPKTFYFHRRSITCREYKLCYLLPEENLSTHAYVENLSTH
jgi:hypothetical protein